MKRPIKKMKIKTKNRSAFNFSFFYNRLFLPMHAWGEREDIYQNQNVNFGIDRQGESKTTIFFGMLNLKCFLCFPYKILNNALYFR